MKNINQPHTNRIPEPVSIIRKAIGFLLLFIPKILAKRVVAIILLAADVPVPRVVELSGACERTVRGLLVKGGLRTKSYDDFTVFCCRIDQIIASTSTNNKDKISKLIGIKVQLFDGLEQINSNTFVNTKPRRKKSQGRTLAA